MQLSNSELKAFKRCRRQWALTYYYQYGPDQDIEPPTGVVNIGIRVHTALEAWYGYDLDPVKVIALLYQEVIDQRPEYEAELTGERDLALAMVKGYQQWVIEEGIDADYEVVNTEHEISYDITTSLGTVVTLRGKLDQLVRRLSDGALLLRDFKTVGTFAKARLLVLDEQMRFYALLQSLNAKQTHERADGALYTMLLRHKRTRGSGPFFEQVHVSYNRHDLNSMWVRVRAEAEEVELARNRLALGEDFLAVAYPNPADHCSWGCPFVDVCPLFDDGSRAWDALRGTHVVKNPYTHYGTETIDHVRRELQGVAGG